MGEEGWRGEERRRNGGRGWTWWKEIVGTIIGAAVVVTVPAAWFLNWSRDMEKQTAVNTSDIRHMAEQRGEFVQQFRDVNQKLDTILRIVLERK